MHRSTQSFPVALQLREYCRRRRRTSGELSSTRCRMDRCTAPLSFAAAAWDQRTHRGSLCSFHAGNMHSTPGGNLIPSSVTSSEIIRAIIGAGGASRSDSCTHARRFGSLMPCLPIGCPRSFPNIPVCFRYRFEPTGVRFVRSTHSNRRPDRRETPRKRTEPKGIGRNVAARWFVAVLRDAAGQGGRALKIIEQSGSLSTSSYLPCRANVAHVANHGAARCTPCASSHAA